VSPPRVADAQGRPIALGAELASGGEGVVFDVTGRPGSVAKLYMQPPDQAKADKIKAMVAMGTDRLAALSAWPTATLHGAGGALVGFTMPKLAGHRPVFQVYGPKLRLRQFPKADWRFLVHAAGNVSRAFGVMHESGLVIGDVNHGNLFVAGDATVRFIDVDSMQVTRGRRRWLCEVGVGTHQPPEMQGVESYREVVRTPNHDAFGLAVLVFQLLCMGRHPFSGRYAGPGEPPDIERAITDSRYAYSADARRTQMSAPPGSLPITALPASIRALFEAAFAPGSVRGGRPTADQWTTELSLLGGSLRRCDVNAAHWFAPVAGTCPWCEVEASSGVALFPAVFVSGRAGSGGIVLLWQEIEAVPDPGPMPVLQRPKADAAQASAAMVAAGRRLRTRKLIAATILASGLALALALLPPSVWVVPFVVTAALAAAFWWLQRPPEGVQARARMAEMRSLWHELEERWRPGPGARFAPTRQQLAELKREYDEIAGQREREMRSLKTNRREQQLKAHLESFEIGAARITGIGKAKVAALLSYGIETAADIDLDRIQGVPGFGAKTAASMVAFRQACEAGFRFDASRAVASSAVSAMDGMLAQRRDKIEAELAAGLARLRAMTVAERRHRETLESQAKTLRPRYAQAFADARAMGIPA
jgi:DNA-binding helix-hairpin-helix protein with protein kinase domain